MQKEQDKAAKPIWYRVLTHWIPIVELSYLFGALLIAYLVYEVFGR